MSLRGRRGFTLVELMVVISVLGILLALILPAVSRAREVARRAGCRTNLKQLGLAIHSYHDTFGSFPPASISFGPWWNSKNFTGWTICILPFLDETPLYRDYDPDELNTAAQNADVREMVLSVMNCPSDTLKGQKGRPASGPGEGLTYATGSYRAMSGRSDGESRPAGGSWFDTANSLPRNWRGAMHIAGTSGLRTERFSDISDGASQSILVGEYSTRPCGGLDDFCNRATFWAYSYTSYNQSSACPECGVRTLLADFDKCAAMPGIGDQHACKRGWGSNHGNGFQTALCDGSVRFVSQSIDLGLFGNLATIAGSELISDF